MNSTKLSKPRLLVPWRALSACLVCAALAGCASLPEPDGLEAAIIKKADGLEPLTPAEGLNVQAAVKNGLLLNPDVREAASNVYSDADEVRIERAALFPSVGSTLDGGIGDAGSGDAVFEMTLTQLLYDGGDTKRAIKVADYELQISYVTFQQTVDDAIVEVLEAYDDVQTQSDLVDVYAQQLSALSELEKLVKTQVENGAVTSSDLLEIRVSLQSAEFSLHDAQLSLAEAQDTLSLLTGQSQGAHVHIAPASCKANGDTDDLILARLEVEQSKLELEKAEKARVPKVVIEPVVQHTVGTSSLPVGLDVGVQSDLLEGGALTATANAARNTLRANQAAVASEERADKITERSLERSLAAAKVESDMLDRQIKMLEETRELYRSQYFSMGTRDLSELLDNEEAYYSRKAELVELKSDMVSDRLDCAIRNRILRSKTGVANTTLYGFPLEVAGG